MAKCSACGSNEQTNIINAVNEDGSTRLPWIEVHSENSDEQVMIRERRTDGRTDRQTERRRQTNKQTDRDKDKDTDTEAQKESRQADKRQTDKLIIRCS